MTSIKYQQLVPLEAKTATTAVNKSNEIEIKEKNERKNGAIKSYTHLFNTFHVENLNNFQWHTVYIFYVSYVVLFRRARDWFLDEVCARIRTHNFMPFTKQ